MHAPPGTVPGVASFCADNDRALSLVVEHLVGLGHQRIAYFIDPISVKSVEGIARYEALCRAASKRNLPAPDQVVLSLQPELFDQYKTVDRPHTAIVCFSDELAIAVLKMAASRGVRVPEDISVVGFDSSPLCETSTPKLTSVVQPVEQMAFEATTHLLKIINTDEPDRLRVTSTLYECGLDIRESTGPVPS
jgi:LacI family transcriptional regulator